MEDVIEKSCEERLIEVIGGIEEDTIEVYDLWNSDQKWNKDYNKSELGLALSYLKSALIALRNVLPFGRAGRGGRRCE